jgi:outer membrane protein TolC
MRFHPLCLPLLASAVAAGAFAQQPPSEPLTISRAVAMAMERYPSVRVSEEQLAAARSAINLARTAYLPKLDAYAQLNRATHNNVFGLLFPQSVIPPISGPVTPASWQNVWGSAVGTTFSWEPFDFGLRRASVAVGEAGEKRAQAAVTRTRFEVGALAADAFVTMAAAQDTVKAAQAGVDRAKVLETVIGAVVRAELRPGVDLTRTQAERALAETQVAQAQQAVEVARATLAQFVGLRPEEIRIDPGKMTGAAPASLTESPAEAHPRVIEERATIDEIAAREKELDRSYFPRFNLLGSAFGRGTGVNPDGTTGGWWSGFGPNTGNWAIGFAMTFALFDFAQIRARREIETHNERAESARLDQVTREITGARDRAAAQFEGARRIADNTPVQLKAARDTEQQATARYRAGLSTAVELADAQRLLTQAEIDDSLARLSVWRAMLAVAAASGNLDPFLDKTK